LIKNYLIATPIKESLPKNKNNKIVILSESALINENGFQKKYNKFFVNDSRWKNNKNFSKDFAYLNKIFERLIILISNQLNSYHKKNFSLRFWKILIGPWLSTFIHIYFERWNNVQSSLEKFKVDKCIFLNLKEEQFIPYDHKNFIYFSQSDIWNQFLYQKIISVFLNKEKIVTKNLPSDILDKEISNSILNKFYKAQFLDYVKKSFMKVFNYFDHKNDTYFLYDTYLGFKNELKLSLKLKQFPIFSLSDDKKSKKETDYSMRKKVLNSISKKNKFEKNLFENINFFFPKIFLENYDDLENFSIKSNIPKKPKVIFTSNSLWYDTKMAYHIGKLLDNKKTKLVHGQHGGCFGLVKHHWPEKHEIEISDKFLTWGWGEKKNNKIKKFYILKNLKKINLKKKNLMIPLRPRKRYFHSLESSSGIESYTKYISNIGFFLKKLDSSITSNTILRLPYKNLPIEEVDFYSNLNKKFNFYNADNFNAACAKSKLIVHASNSTPFLETMSANIPTILILDKYHEVRQEMKFIFKILKENNIFFNNTNLAAKFINKLWRENIDTWWQANKTQKAIKLFQDNCVRKNDNIVNECHNLLTKI
jgi:putative transferase (TIGR04331 family)